MTPRGTAWSWLMPVWAGWVLSASALSAQVTITIDTSPAGRQQVIDGFGTCLAYTEAEQTWWQQLYYDDLQASVLRIDLTPAFKSPYSDYDYNSPWFGNNPPLPGPDNNNVRTYTNAADYTRLFAGRHAAIAVMGPDIDQNTNYFNLGSDVPRVSGHAAQAGLARTSNLGDFKLIGSLWSPAPWLKVSSGNKISGQSGNLPVNGTPWPFIWGGNFAGGKLDVSGTPLPEFDDSALGGSGPTSALTQFARCTAAYLRGFQNAYQVKFYAVSLQNELNFEEFYGSCFYPLSSQYIAALKAVRAELDKYPDLAGIQLMGPEDEIGSDNTYGMWQYGSGPTTIHKNLEYLQNLGADPTASEAAAFFCIHGYITPGTGSLAAWKAWVNGWTSSPAPGLPASVKGTAYYQKKSWMTESSGENPAWLYPTNSFPNSGAWSIALKIHQALTAGRECAYVYWQLTDHSPIGAETLTDSSLRGNSPKYVAAKHFFRYIRPNAVRVNATVAGSATLNASAYYHPGNQTLTVVLVNSSPDAVSATFAGPAEPAGVTAFLAFTSSNNSYWQSSAVPIDGGQVAVTVPGYGVVTLYGARGTVTPSIANPGQDATGQFTFSVSTQLGVSYVVEYSNSPVNAVWRPLQTLLGSGGNLTVGDAASTSATRYYRVRVQ